MSFIVTRHGAEINLTPGAISTTEHDVRDIAHALSLINRFNGHTCRPYSVAEHSLLVWELVAATGAHARTQLAALMHDAHEYITGDTATPLKTTASRITEDLWAASVATNLGYLTAPQDQPGIIKHADLVALATEKRDLLPRTPKPWPMLLCIEPSAAHNLMAPSRTVPACNWEFWRDEFLDKYFELQGICDALDAASPATKQAA